MPQSAQQPELEYAQPPPPHRRRMSRRLLWVGFGLLAFVLYYGWLSEFVRSVPDLYWQRQCLTYAPSADRVVYTDDPAEAATLASSDPSYGSHPLVHISRPPATWTAPAVHHPRPLERLLHGRSRSRALFLHRRENPAGEERLVLVDTDLIVQPESTRIEISGRAIRVRTLTPLRYRDCYVWKPGLYILLSHGDRFEVLAGQPDPADQSRFAIPYRLNGQAGVIAGTVAAGDRVELTVSEGPLGGKLIESPYK